MATSGGVLSARDDPQHPHFRPAELDVLVEEAEAAGYHLMTTIIDIDLNDGRRISGRADFGKGSPAFPMSYDEVAGKFRENAEFAGMAGKLVAEAIAGTAERFDVFAAIPHANFPGGAPLRRPLLVLAMLYYRLRDLL